MSAGYDTRWARRKLDRARAHLAELRHASATWLEPARLPLKVVLADDDRHLELVLTFVKPPPLDEWSLIAGDCAHNIRTALDVFIWANSTMPLTESQRRHIAYPLLPFADEDDDPAASDRMEDQSRDTRRAMERKVAGLPEPLRSRVLENVRWASRPDDGEAIRHQSLPLIVELDNIDKHRLALDMAASWSTATWDIRAWGPSGENVQVDLDWDRPDLGLLSVLNGPVVMATGTTDGPITRMQAAATVSLSLRVRFLDRSADVLFWLGDFIDDVDGLLDVLGASVTRGPVGPSSRGWSRGA